MLSTGAAFRGALRALTLIAALGVTLGATTASSTVRRMELDRLKWAPDGNGLAVEARWLDGARVTTDTLLFDLSIGATIPLSPRPLRFALHEGARRLAVIDRYALWCGPLDHPERVLPLVRLDPASGDAIHLGWNHAGDTLFLAVSDPTGCCVDFSAIAPADGVRHPLGRRDSGGDCESYWGGLAAIEPLSVTPSPLPGLYQAIGDNLFFIERTEMDTPVARGQWFFDLHHRSRFDGSERILARRMAPEALLVAPDSLWLAIPGRDYRADYGGYIHRVLWLATPDGKEFFSVQPSGVKDTQDLHVTALTWSEGRLWFLCDTGLFVVSPGDGRSRPVPLGPAPPEWARTLPDAARLWTCRLPEIHADSLTALQQCRRMRGDGWPAWVAGPAGGPFRVAVGAAADEATLRSILAPLPGGPELLRDFPPESRGAMELGTPLPYAAARAPGTHREAWLTAVGPPGLRAGELWLTENNGARRIRLFRAIWTESLTRRSGETP